MIWLASFPRSGNTFFRILLHEVYGIESSSYHQETAYSVDKDYTSYAVVKTHLLPDKIIPNAITVPAVYLVRDGRDALVSIAHHRKDIVAPGTDFYQNLREAIVSTGDTFFGGWSKNVSQWFDRASIVIKFEDLITNPIQCVEGLRKIIDLPKPDMSKIPTFDDLKSMKIPYGKGGKYNLSDKEEQEWKNKFFRRGKVGAWKDEMPEDLHELFWRLHGDMMIKMGYTDGSLYGKMRKKVLIEATKIIRKDGDGGERYVTELLKDLLPIAESKKSTWEFHVFWGPGKISNILEIPDLFIPKLSSPKTLSKLKRRLQFVYLRVKPYILELIENKFPSVIVNILKNFRRKVLSIKNDRIPKHDFLDYDAVHLTIPQFYRPFLYCRTNLIMTLHDFTHDIYPQFHDKRTIDNAIAGINTAIEKETEFICVSESTRKDFLLRHDEVDSKKVHTVYETCDPEKFKRIDNPELLISVKRKYNIPDRPYLLSLSTLEPRKNLSNTIKAFISFSRENPEADIILVIAGKKGWEYKELFKNSEFKSNHIVFTGFIEDIDLPVIYSGAIALTYISFYEGFGLPPLEAMYCGTPVIYGNNSSMPEVVGSGGLPTDADNIEDIKNTFKKIILNKKLRNKLSLDALNCAKRFSPSQFIEGTLNIYENIIALKQI